MPEEITNPYTWGAVHCGTLSEVREAIHSYISDDFDNHDEALWLVKRGRDVWEVEFTITLHKKPPPAPRPAPGTARLWGSGT